MPDSSVPLGRVTRSREQARAAYDRMSRWYDAFAGRWEQKLRTEALAQLRIADGDRVLEVGCGTGQDSPAIAALAGATGSAHGIDLSPGMLAVASARLRRAGLCVKVHLVCGDAVSMPYIAHSFDAIFMSFTLELFDAPDIPLVLAECRRTLAARGRLCVISLSNSEGLNVMGRLYEWGHRQFPTVLDCRPIPVQAIVAGAGFRVTGVTRSSLWGLQVETVVAHS